MIMKLIMLMFDDDYDVDCYSLITMPYFPTIFFFPSWLHSQRCSSQISNVYAAAIVQTVHIIWLVRNAICLCSAKISMHASMAKIVTLVDMSGFNSNDKWLVADVALLDNLLIPPSHQRVSDIVPVIWKPPTITWVKANNDGSIIGFNS